MTTVLVVITDGRGEYLRQTLDAAEENLDAEVGILVDDSGDPEYADWLEQHWPNFWHFHHDKRRGLAGAVASAWARAREVPEAEYLFHLEEDFVLTEAVDLDAMRSVLEANPRLAQLTLKRQPWSVEEHSAGGIVELYPDSYAEQESEHGNWLEQRRLFSFNPSLVSLRALGLVPHGGLERDVTDALLGAGWSFGMWGRRDDPPRCLHIGHERSPRWQL